MNLSAQPVDRELIPIIVDTPVTEPQLGFKPYADGITNAILGGSQRNARFTVGLYGPWGTGKSSLLKKIQTSLETSSSSDGGQDKETILVGWFDAWRYATSSGHDILHPILSKIQALITDYADKNPSFEFNTSPIGSIGDEFTALRQSDAQGRMSSNLSVYTSPFEKLEALGKRLKARNVKIVMLIDDLDRCPPESIVDLIETLHVLTDVDHLMFVLALDYDYLISAIQDKYPRVNPERFVEKIVQIPFHIPRSEFSAERLGELIDRWEEDYESTWFQHVDPYRIEVISRKALRSNPRQIKRLLNLFMLTRAMREEAVQDKDTAERLLTVVGLQIAWPQEYARLHQQLQEHKESLLRDVPWYKEITLVLSEEDQPEETEVGPSATSQTSYSHAESADNSFGQVPTLQTATAEGLLERVLSEAIRPNGARADVSPQAGSDENRVRLAKYLTDEILPGEIHVKDLLKVMDLIDNITDTGISESAATSQVEIPEQLKYYEKATEELQDLYKDLNNYVAKKILKYESAEILKRVSDLSTVIPIRPVTGARVPKGETVFTSLIRARNNQLKLYINIDPASEVDKLDEALDATTFGKHGSGNLEVTLTPDKFFANERHQREIVYGWLQQSADAARRAAEARDRSTA